MSISYSGPKTINAITYTSTSTHSWDFEPMTILVSSPGPSALIISFDGETDHGRVEPNSPKQWRQKVRRIFLRLEVAGAQLAYVETENF